MRRLTDRYVKSIEPTDKRQYITDKDLGNLEVQVTPTGKKTYYVRYSAPGGMKRYRIGPAHIFKAKDARDFAGDFLVKMRMGKALPTLHKLTVKKVIEDYIEYCKNVKKRRPNTIASYGYSLDAISSSLLNTDANLVTQADAFTEWDRLSKAGKEVMANRTLTLIRAAWTHHEKRQELDSNPWGAIDKHKEKPKRTYIPFGMIQSFRQSVDYHRNEKDAHAADMIEAMLFTGLRLGNCIDAIWKDVHLDEGRWHIPRTKNGEPMDVYLHPFLRELLLRRWNFRSNQYVFSGRKSVKHTLKPISGTTGIKSLTAHSLRHTFTNVARKALKHDLKAIDVLTSHVSQSISVTTYMHMDAGEVRQAFELVGNKILELSMNETDSEEGEN